MMTPQELSLHQQKIEKIKRKAKTKRAVSSTISHLLLGLMAVVWLVPVVWLVVTAFSSFKGMSSTQFFPQSYTLGNFYQLLFQTDSVNQFPRWFINTLVVSFFTFIISTIFVLMVSYTMSRLEFKGRKTFMNIGVLIGLFPGVLSMVAVYFILKIFGLTGTLLSLVMVYSASAGLGYLVSKGFFDTIPTALSEAAKIDGASEFQIFTKIIIPLSKPIIVYTAMTSFLGPWTDFFTARIMIPATESQNYTVAVGLFAMLERGLINSYFSVFAAGSLLVAIPIASLFIVMQKYYVEGVTGGSVK